MIGGRYGKVKGFDFYIQDRERFKPFQRRRLLKESEDLISNIINEEMEIHHSYERIDSDLVFLDSAHTDLELMEHWNLIYNKYGYRMIPFRDKWEREFIGSTMEFGDKNDESKSFKPLKIDWLEKRKMKKKYIELIG